MEPRARPNDLQLGRLRGVQIAPGKMGTSDDPAAVEIEVLREEIASLESRRDSLVRDRDHYKSYYESSPDQYVSLSVPDARIVECNQRTLDARGYTREQLIGQPLSVLIAPEDRERAAGIFIDFVSEGCLRDVELLAVRRDGTTFPMSLNVTARYEDGVMVYSRGAGRDLTSAKRDERALLLSETRFRRLAETMNLVPYEVKVLPSRPGPDAGGAAVFSEDWYLKHSPRYIGRQIEQVLGYARDRWYEPGFWFSRIHPDDRAAIVELAGQTTRGERLERTEFRLRAAAGHYVPMCDLTSITTERDASLTLRGVLVDMTEATGAERAQTVLMRELDHRVKNTQATLIAVAEQTLDASTSIDDFLDTFDGRVSALGRIHNAMATGGWASIDLHELVETFLAPYCGDDSPNLAGPSVKLPLEYGRNVGMILHELSTNAVKYGALSTDSGSLEVRWDASHDAGTTKLDLEWKESGGPPCRAPARYGYGLEFIRRLVPFGLGGDVDINFGPAGFSCRIHALLEQDDRADA